MRYYVTRQMETGTVIVAETRAEVQPAGWQAVDSLAPYINEDEIAEAAAGYFAPRDGAQILTSEELQRTSDGRRALADWRSDEDADYELRRAGELRRQDEAGIIDDLQHLAAAGSEWAAEILLDHPGYEELRRRYVGHSMKDAV